MWNKKSLALETLLRLIIVAVGIIVILPIAKNWLGPIASDIFGWDDEKKSFDILVEDISRLDDGEGKSTSIILEGGDAIVGIGSGSDEFRCIGCHQGDGSSVYRFQRLPEFGCSIEKSCICRCEGINWKSAGAGTYDLECRKFFCKQIDFAIASPFNPDGLGRFTWENGFFYVRHSSDELTPFNGIGTITQPNYNKKQEVYIDRSANTIGVCPSQQCISS
ncbi:hypothetical protein HYU10_03050 [Candidatus Woesearchaeota archaeon]|nr:hypothetical protein [Candidatus Woesearchaeota archaeon]